MLRKIVALPFFLVGAPLTLPASLMAHGGGPHTKLEWVFQYVLLVPFYLGWPFLWTAIMIGGG